VAARSGRGHRARWSVDLDEDDGDVPEVVRARVTATSAWSRHDRLVPAGGVRVVARRRADRDDRFDWQLVFDRDTDPHDPSLQAQGRAAARGGRRTIR
jgi:hypothetical protein